MGLGRLAQDRSRDMGQTRNSGQGNVCWLAYLPLAWLRPHARPRERRETLHKQYKLEHGTNRRQLGKGPMAWGVGPYARPYLLIDLGPEKPEGERYRTAEDLVDEAIMFWRTFFDGNRPENIETE